MLGKQSLIFVLILLLCSFIPIFFVRGAYDREGEQLSLYVRNAFSFNNPNQLAYFAVLIYSMMLIVRSQLSCYIYHKMTKKMIFVLSILIFVLAHFFVLYSASRSGIVSILFLDLFGLLWHMGKTVFSVIAVLIFCSLALSIVKLPEIDYYNIMVLKKIERTDINESLSKRIEGRFFENIKSDWALIYGSGKTVPSSRQWEVHNGFVDIFLSYGLVGLLLFLGFIWNLAARFFKYLSIRENIYYITALLPVFLYNVAHNGFRFRLFWVFLAFWLAAVQSTVEMKDGAYEDA
jgi:O-antigen ligase